VPPIDNNPATPAGGELTGPPSGRFTTTAVSVPDSPPRHTGTLGAGNVITGGGLVVDVIARDPYTGSTARIDGVNVTMGAGDLVTGIPPSGVFDLTCENYEAFRRRDAARMRATLKQENHTVQNLSIPQQVRVRDTVDSFSDSPSPTCRQYNENVQAAQRHLGLTHQRDDLNIVQGRINGRSPGMVVNQQRGYVSLFGIDGKQQLSMRPGAGIEARTTSFDTGTAMQENRTLQYGGLPQMNNPVNSVIPQGTILTPQPQTVPMVLKILNMVATIVDMIDLVQACKDAVDVMTASSGREREQRLNEIRAEAEGPSSLERAYYGDNDEQLADAQRRASEVQPNRST